MMLCDGIWSPSFGACGAVAVIGAKWELLARLRLARAKSEVGAEAKAVRGVVLIKFGRSEIAILKETRSLLCLGLNEAKEFVCNAPAPVKCGLDKPEVGALKAEVELR